MTILFAAIVISIYAGKYLASRVGRQPRNPYALCWEIA